MVRQENSLDDVILQIFEDQEDVFHFPVTTQREARAFVKALHHKGVAYEALYTAVEEFEPNFTSWRKGLGKSGIGNRVIERINQPLQELLLSDGDEGEEEEEEEGKRKSNVTAKQTILESFETVIDSPKVPQSDSGRKQVKLNSASSSASPATKTKELENASSDLSNHKNNCDTSQSKLDNECVKTDKQDTENKTDKNELNTELVKPIGELTNSTKTHSSISNDKKLKDNEVCDTNNEHHLNSANEKISKTIVTVDTQFDVNNENQHKKAEALNIESVKLSMSPTPCVEERSLSVHQTPVAFLQVKSACNSESDESFVSVGSDIDRAVSPQESATVFGNEKVLNTQSVSIIDSNNQVLENKNISSQMHVHPVILESGSVIDKSDESLVMNKMKNDVAQVKLKESAMTNTESMSTHQPCVQAKESVSKKEDTNLKQPLVGLIVKNEPTANQNDKAIKIVTPMKDQNIVDGSLVGDNKITGNLKNSQSTNEQNFLGKTNSTTITKTNNNGAVQTDKAKSVDANKEAANHNKKVNNTILVTQDSAPELECKEGRNVQLNRLAKESSPEKAFSIKTDTTEKNEKTEINKGSLADVNQNVVIRKTVGESHQAAPQAFLTKSNSSSNKVNESALMSKDKFQESEVSIKQEKLSAAKQEAEVSVKQEKPSSVEQESEVAVKQEKLSSLKQEAEETVKQEKQSTVKQEPFKQEPCIQKSSADKVSTPIERNIDHEQDTDDFVMLDSAVSPSDELTSGAWVLEPKPSELEIESTVEDEISESYDSDIDLENLDCLPAVRNQLRLLKSTSRLANVDGTGYIYAFTDSSNDAKNHRIKVGASRQPYKKLQQATLFNVDVKLVSAVRVGSTKSALLDILGQLQPYLIVDAKYWFLGPLDDILQILMETCMNYPVQQSPSMPSSPSAVAK